MIQTTEQILADRLKTHGKYTDHASCTQALLEICMSQKNWASLRPTQKESIHMFCHKMGRILTGNPNIDDHWDDIAGYAKLIPQEYMDVVAKEHLDEEVRLGNLAPNSSQS